MRERDSRLVVAAVAIVALAVGACGGGESSGLATLADTATTVPAVAADEIEPVSEPTAVTVAVSDTTGTVAPSSQAGDEAAGVEPQETAATTVGAEPADPAEEASVAEPEDSAAEESAASGDSAAEPVVSEDLTDEERLLAFAVCMREHGVDFPDPVVEADGTVTFGFRPGGGGGGLQRLGEIGRDPDLPAARDACSGMLEGLAFGPGTGGIDLIEIQDRLLEFARCMRDNGVDMADPDLSRFGPGGNDGDQGAGPFGEIDRDDPDIATAFAVCQQELPQAAGPRLGGRG